MTSLFRQFPEIYNSKHTKVWSGRRSTKSANWSTCNTVSSCVLEEFPNKRSLQTFDLQTKRHSPLPHKLFLKQIVFTHLKQRKGKSQKGDLYENMKISAQCIVVCIEWWKLGLCLLNQVPKYTQWIVNTIVNMFSNEACCLKVIQAPCGHQNWTLQ